MQLKIYCDRKFLPSGQEYVSLLYPFWGVPPVDYSDHDFNRFDEYVDNGKQYFYLTDNIDEADIFLFPGLARPGYWHESSTIAEQLANFASQNKKRVLIFFGTDSDEQIPIDKSIIFRSSFYSSKRRRNEFAVPGVGFAGDFVKQYYKDMLPLRKKTSKPTIGYSGYIDYKNTMEYLKRFVSNKQAIPIIIQSLMHGKLQGRFNEIIAPRWSYLRGCAIRLLKSCSQINTNFIIRDGFSGRCNLQHRLEYVQNLATSDYALVVRGCGNFSYRLYEVMSLGRIPVFVNTDCVLPFDHIIDWKKYFVWIEEDDLSHIADRLLEFHERISDFEFEDLQKRIRSLYIEWLSPNGFYKNLWKCL